MKKFFCLVLLFIFPVFTVSARNNVVKFITPQSQKLNFFQNFQNEKDYMVDLAFSIIERQTQEKPVAWYSKYSSFIKGDDYSEGTIYVKCENHKLATVKIKYEMIDTAFKNKIFFNMSESDISGISPQTIALITKYKAIPNICYNKAEIKDNFLE